MGWESSVEKGGFRWVGKGGRYDHIMDSFLSSVYLLFSRPLIHIKVTSTIHHEVTISKVGIFKNDREEWMSQVSLSFHLRS